MLKKGTRLFSTGTLLLFVVAMLHTMGLFSAPPDERGKLLLQSMRDYQIDMGLGMTPSVADVQMSLGLTMTIFLVFFGILNVGVLVADSQGETLRRISLLDAACMWSLAITYAFYRIPPPFVSFVVLGLIFTVAFLRRPAA